MLLDIDLNSTDRCSKIQLFTWSMMAFNGASNQGKRKICNQQNKRNLVQSYMCSSPLQQAFLSYQLFNKLGEGWAEKPFPGLGPS